MAGAGAGSVDLSRFGADVRRPARSAPTQPATCPSACWPPRAWTPARSCARPARQRPGRPTDPAQRRATRVACPRPRGPAHRRRCGRRHAHRRGRRPARRGPDAPGHFAGEPLAALLVPARERRMRITLDLLGPSRDTTLERLEPILPLVDCFVPNRDQLCAMTGLENPGDTAAAVRARGVATVLVTLGQQAGLVVSDHGVEAVPLCRRRPSTPRAAATLLRWGDRGSAARLGSGVGGVAQRRRWRAGGRRARLRRGSPTSRPARVRRSQRPSPASLEPDVVPLRRRRRRASAHVDAAVPPPRPPARAQRVDGARRATPA